MEVIIAQRRQNSAVLTYSENGLCFPIMEWDSPFRWLWGQCSGGRWDRGGRGDGANDPEQCESREYIDSP